jgi:hypothetical protein
MKLIKKLKTTISKSKKEEDEIYYKAPKSDSENGDCDPLTCLICLLAGGLGFVIYDNYLKD